MAACHQGDLVTLKRWRLALAGALTVQAAISVLVLLRAASTGVANTGLAVSDLIALAASIVAAGGFLGAVMTSRAQDDRRDQVIAAAAATSHDWVWQSDVAARITYSNTGVTALLGYQPDEVLGVRETDLLYDDTDRAALKSMREKAEAANAGETVWPEVETDWRHRDGSRVRLQGSAVAIRNRRGHLQGFHGSRRLVTEDHQSREAREASRRRIVQLLQTGDVDVALQPIVEGTTGAVVGAEALARFGDGRSPDLWFADAHEVGLTRELDELTFRRALTVVSALPDGLYLSVNASPALLMHPGFRASILASDLPLSRLVFEVTEHARVPDYVDLNNALEPFRARGVRFAIDDTGAGYASMAHVLSLNPDIIKLDRALVQNLDQDRARRSLVTALVLLAFDLGATITGEGVETDDELTTLNTLGVDQAQGYLLARPSTDPRTWESWWPQDASPPAPLPWLHSRSREVTRLTSTEDSTARRH
jgi:PAS domain S-box-containing protein